MYLPEGKWVKERVGCGDCEDIAAARVLWNEKLQEEGFPKKFYKGLFFHSLCIVVLVLCHIHSVLMC